MYYPIKVSLLYKDFHNWKINCTVFNFLAQYGFTLSMFLALCISIERLIAIRFPIFYQHKVTTRSVFIILVILYVVLLIKIIIELIFGNDMSRLENIVRQLPHRFRMQFTCPFFVYFKDWVSHGTLIYPFFFIGSLLIIIYSYIFYLVYKLRPRNAENTESRVSGVLQNTETEKMERYMAKQKKILKTMMLIFLTFYMIYVPGIAINLRYENTLPTDKLGVGENTFS